MVISKFNVTNGCVREYPTLLHTHDDVDRDLSGDEIQPEKRPILVREKNKKKKSLAAIPEPLLKEIDKIHLSCKQTVKKLYSAFNTGKGSHGSPHFTKSGCMVLEGNVQLDEPALARLLTTVVRPTGKKSPDLPHQNAFLRVLKDRVGRSGRDSLMVR